MHLSCRRRTLTQNTWQYSRYFNFDFNNDGYFLGCQKSTYNLENNKCICQEKFVVYHLYDWIYLLQNYFLSYVCLKDIYKTFKGTGKIQFVSEPSILLNL